MMTITISTLEVEHRYTVADGIGAPDPDPSNLVDWFISMIIN